jgi:hypothetical protein
VPPRSAVLFLGGRSGVGPQVTAVLLTAGDATARHRLTQREIDTALQRHVEHITDNSDTSPTANWTSRPT